MKRLLEGSGLKEELRIETIRNPSMNASAHEDGTIYVNVGLFANISTEAELAAVLSHELGHVVLQHNYSLYKSYRNYLHTVTAGNVIGGLKGVLIRNLARSVYSSHSINEEESADKYAVDRIQSSGYTYKGLVSLFESFERQSRLYDSCTGFDKRSAYFRPTLQMKGALNLRGKDLKIPCHQDGISL